MDGKTIMIIVVVGLCLVLFFPLIRSLTKLLTSAAGLTDTALDVTTTVVDGVVVPVVDGAATLVAAAINLPSTVARALSSKGLTTGTLDVTCGAKSTSPASVIRKCSCVSLFGLGPCSRIY